MDVWNIYIYSYIDPAKPPQLIGSPMAVPDGSCVGRVFRPQARRVLVDDPRFVEGQPKHPLGPLVMGYTQGWGQTVWRPHEDATRSGSPSEVIQEVVSSCGGGCWMLFQALLY